MAIKDMRFEMNADNQAAIKGMLGLLKVAPILLLEILEQEKQVSSIEKGIIYINDATGELYHQVPKSLAKIAESIYGVSRYNTNHTFFKSIDDVLTLGEDRVKMLQSLYYLTTYGQDFQGNPYSPAEWNAEEEYTAEDFEGKFTIVRLKAICEIQEEINDLVKKMTALGLQDTNYISDVARAGFITEPIENIQSREIRCILHRVNNTVPQTGDEWLRFVNYLISGTPTLVKDRNTIARFKYNAESIHQHLLRADVTELAKVFLRNKRLFLAMKEYNPNKRLINTLRRLANVYHEPHRKGGIKDFFSMDRQAQVRILERATVFEVIKLINFFNKKYGYPDAPMVYQIRNGSTWVDTNPSNNPEQINEGVAKLLLDTFNSKVKHLRNKKVYIPKGIDYAAPTTRKQMVGNIPWGTRLGTGLLPDTVQGGLGMSVGIYWHDKGGRTDLDLHGRLISGEHIGWNSNAITDRVVYSGDLTSAPNGATEVMWIRDFGTNEKMLFSVTHYSGNPREFTVFVAQDKVDNIGRNYEIKPSNLLAPMTNIKFAAGQQLSTNLGLVEDGYFYIYGGTVDKGRIPTVGNSQEIVVNAGIVDVKSKVRLGSLLEWAGVARVDSAEDADINLSPEVLTANTFFELFEGVEGVEE